MIHAVLLIGDGDRLDVRVEALEHAARDLGFRVVLGLTDSIHDGRDDRALARALLDKVAGSTGEALERRARAAYERLGFGPAWENLEPGIRDSYRVAVRYG